MKKIIPLNHPELGAGHVAMERGEFHGWAYGVRSIGRFPNVEALDVSHLIRHPRTGEPGLKLVYPAVIADRRVTVIRLSEEEAELFAAAYETLRGDRRAATAEAKAVCRQSVEDARRADAIMDGE